MRLRQLFIGSTHSVLWYLALAGVVPIASLSLLGLVFLWQQDLLLWILLGWLIVTVAGYALFVALPARRIKDGQTTASTHGVDNKNSGKQSSETLPEHLSARPDWTDHDNAIWQKSCRGIDTLLATGTDWQNLPEQSLSLLSNVSAHYNTPSKPDDTEKTENRRLEYRFTVPEVLLVLSVASNRYRDVVLSHIPYAERVTVASLLQLYDRQRTIKTGYTWLNNIRRTLRLANPVAAAMGELKDQVTNRVFDQLSINVQTDLKRLLLQEVVQVGIDLYSGKLKSSPAELQDFRSRAYQEDAAQTPQALEPIRIVLLGQTSAGKSSLINALADTLEAEVDILPTTNQTQAHALMLENAAAMHLIDTMGLGSEGDEPNLEIMTEQAQQADIICLVARANQPARAPDHALYQQLQQVFATNPERRQPPLLLILTHIDQLSPKQQWSPPYDLTHCEDTKSKNISAALKSCMEQIQLPIDTPAIPVCLASDKGLYNVDTIAAQLMLLQDDATLTQLNRRRVERGQQSISWRDRWSQVKRLGLVLGKASTGGKN